MSFSGSKFGLIEQPIWSLSDLAHHDVISCSAVEGFLALGVFCNGERILEEDLIDTASRSLTILSMQGTCR